MSVGFVTWLNHEDNNESKIIFHKISSISSDTIVWNSYLFYSCLKPCLLVKVSVMLCGINFNNADVRQTEMAPIQYSLCKETWLEVTIQLFRTDSNRFKKSQDIT